MEISYASRSVDFGIKIHCTEKRVIKVCFFLSSYIYSLQAALVNA